MWFALVRPVTGDPHQYTQGMYKRWKSTVNMSTFRILLAVHLASLVV